MKLNINKEQTGHLMTDLGISVDRCQELCGLIERTVHSMNQGKDGISLAAVLKTALEESRSENETVFISVTAGEYYNEYLNHKRGQGNSLAELFAQLGVRTSQL